MDRNHGCIERHEFIDISPIFLAINLDEKVKNIDNLKIKSIIVNKGLVMKRIKIRARGRADRIAKPMCHIEIKLAEKKQEEENGSES